MVSIQFHPEAQAEYEVALAWYQSRSPQAATRFENEVQRVLDLISAAPETFPPYDEEHRFAILRRFPYSIVFQVHPGLVYIIAVAHSSRAAGYWQGRT